MKTDLRSNAERPRGDRPEPVRERDDPHRGYWLGGGNVWRRRALAAEGMIAALRDRLAEWKPIA